MLGLRISCGLQGPPEVVLGFLVSLGETQPQSPEADDSNYFEVSSGKAISYLPWSAFSRI